MSPQPDTDPTTPEPDLPAENNSRREERKEKAQNYVRGKKSS